MKLSQKELRDYHIQIGHRDTCAHLIPPLQDCRRRTKFAPWAEDCKHMKHILVRCIYKDYLRRLKDSADRTKKNEQPLQQDQL